ncbi:hypothetical protein WMY93_007143 [Mugilogobius chulae]|uniref:Uncharacterized protein n=1 Tax=Mugilogobius chulae TaxID=88201 RepID=A0AAW0PT38_9GOBI
MSGVVALNTQSPPDHQLVAAGLIFEVGQTWQLLQNCPSAEEEPEDELEGDSDGQPYESDEEDPELARKRKELQVIQEQIMLKRAFLALKTVDHKKVNPGICTEVARGRESNEPLRDRVKVILRQRNRFIKIKQMPVFSASPPPQINTLPVEEVEEGEEKEEEEVEEEEEEEEKVEEEEEEEEKVEEEEEEEEEKSSQGFMLFLDILNKGVDIDKLKEMANDEEDSMPQSPQSRQNGGETLDKTSSLSSLPVEKIRLTDDQPLPNPSEQQKHLKNILESLGLSLGTDEMSKLADRTQERLYGKRQRQRKEDKTKKLKLLMEIECQPKEDREKYSPLDHTRASSFTSISSPSPHRMKSSSFGSSALRTKSPSLFCHRSGRKARHLFCHRSGRKARHLFCHRSGRKARHLSVTAQDEKPVTYPVTAQDEKPVI